MTATMATKMTITMAKERWAMERRDMMTTTMAMGDDDDHGDGAMGDEVDNDGDGTMGNGDGDAAGDGATRYGDNDYG